MSPLRRVALAVAFLAPGAPWAQAPVPMSQDDARAVYEEIAHTHDGLAYRVNLLRFREEGDAQAAWKQIQEEPRFRVLTFDKLFPRVSSRDAAYFTFEPAVRQRLAGLANRERAGPIRTPPGWTIVELLSTRAAPMPTFEQMERILPKFVSLGIVPDAAALRSDPRLVQRTAANRIRTLENLAKAPADLDVNVRLSTGDTLLLRALFDQQDLLAAALLSRGADPNACARRFCALHVAAFHKKPAMVSQLIKAGADPNQRDPDAGVLEGPLGMAAYLGELGVVTQLVEAGANVNGNGKGELPLQAAAAGRHRPVVELLVAKGADLLAVDDRRPRRGILDAARSTGDDRFVSWVRESMLAQAQRSGRYDWQGWIEQEGRRFPIDGSAVTLRRAPFRIVVAMLPERALYATAAADPRVFDILTRPAPGSAFFASGDVAADGENANFLIVHAAPQGSLVDWGGSELWSMHAGRSSFTSVLPTPSGYEHVREIRELIMRRTGGADDALEVTQYRSGSIYLVLGTHLRMSTSEVGVYQGRGTELRFVDN